MIPMPAIHEPGEVPPEGDKWEVSAARAAPAFTPPAGPLAAAVAKARVLPYRRRGKAVRHLRRHPLLRMLKPFLLALAIVGLPAGTVDWAFTSPVFALRDLVLETDGGSAPAAARVSQVWVHQLLRPFLGQNLPRLSLPRIDALVCEHPWVKATDLRKELPGRLSVRVIERRAVALYRGEGGLLYIDDQGRTIAPFDPLDGAVDLLVLSGGSDGGDLRGAVELAREIAAFRPRWSEGLSEIEILGEKDFRIFTADLPFPLVVRAGALESKSRRLAALLPQIVERYDSVAAVDLRFARRIIVQPSVPGRRSGSRDIAEKGGGG
ncbi:MAG: hypothetical protein GY856_51605 [bacterium]|nr:hypothetical protein [bacterium]